MATDNVKPVDTPTVGQRVDHVIDSTREKYEHLASEAKDKVAEVKGKVTEAKGKVAEVKDEVKEKVHYGREVVEDCLEKSHAAVGELRKKSLDDVIVTAKDFAKQHPGTTLLGGLAVGFLAGFLFRGGRD